MKTPTHLNALRAFEATSRLGGYVAAAEEIGVTPEAVGQLVRTLEAYLGIQLFHRGKAGRRLRPTQEAQSVLPNLTDAFKTLSGVAERLRTLSAVGVLTVTVAPSITAKWLMPRLPKFLGEQPQIDIRLDITDRTVDLAAGEADIAIRYGQGNWPGVSAQSMIGNEKVFPVCSPSMIEQHPGLRTPNGLSKHTLIHDTTISSPRFPTWRDWFRNIGLVGDEGVQVLEFNAALMAIEAAVLGQGVALVREQLVQDELNAGSLVQLYKDYPVISGWSYYVVTPKKPCEKAMMFADWLLGQVE